MKTYEFRISEKPTKLSSAPSSVDICRNLTIRAQWELDDTEIIKQVAETFVRWMQNDGFSLPVISAATYNVLCAYLHQGYGIPNPKLFFDRLGNPYTVEGIAAEAGATGVESGLPSPPPGSEAEEASEAGFERFCEHIAQRGSFARKIYGEFMESLEEE